MSVDEDSGVGSTSSVTPCTSPIIDVLRTIPVPPDNILLPSQTSPGSSADKHNFMKQYQQQMDVMNQLQILNVFGAGSLSQMPLSSEMQRLILENQLPYPPPFLQNPWAMNMMMNMQGVPQARPEQSSQPTIPVVPKESPLDLSKKGGELLLDNDAFAKRLQLGTKTDKDSPTDELGGKVFAVKRNYSAQSLALAVEDIRCGKLGTRRASVVYGIPRSTLRNKIYKLEAAEEVNGAIPPKRRRPGGQSIAEKKLADDIAKNHKRSVSQCSEPNSEPPGSPDSDISTSSSESCHSEEKKEMDMKPLSSNIQPPTEWTSTLWQNLFNAQKTQMTADIMNLSQVRAVPEQKTAYQSEDWKKSRPKRGQYRKYDKNALDEAVRSVRRGEMSVHRAGSFYGVPHSTLEYKVKERNLMRKKKDTLTPSSSIDEGHESGGSEPSPTIEHNFLLASPFLQLKPSQ